MPMVVTAVPTRLSPTPKVINTRTHNNRTHLTVSKHNVIRNVFALLLDWNNWRYWYRRSRFVGKPNRKRSWYSIWEGDSIVWIQHYTLL